MKKKLSFILNIDSDLKAGAERILSLLGVGLGSGIGVSAELSGKKASFLRTVTPPFTTPKRRFSSVSSAYLSKTRRRATHLSFLRTAFSPRSQL